jgi:4-carboxymuconolactone decarboxylase
VTGKRGYRLSELGDDALDEAQRQVVAELSAGPRRGVVGPYDAWLRHPELARRARLVGDYCRFEAEVPRDIAELVILVAGRYWDAPYEFAAHAPLARQAGLDPQIVESLRAGERPELPDGQAEAAYDLVTELLSSHEVSDSTYARAAEALGEAMLVDVVAIAGYYAMVCMTLNVFRMPLPEGVDHPFAR